MNKVNTRSYATPHPCPSFADPVVIVAAKRTPIGHFGGYFKSTPAPILGQTAIAAALAQCGSPLTRLDHESIDDVFMGCVLQAGLGQAPARQAALGAGLPPHTPCTTLNKMCGSGMQAVMMAHDAIMAGSRRCVVAGGMENMSMAPYLLPKARFGYRLGHGECIDSLLWDGLLDVYHNRQHMGVFAEQCATQFNITRATQDAYAARSLERAKTATQQGWFKEEIAPISLPHALQQQDEGPTRLSADKIPHLKPAFVENGTITAANASSISDGACALVLMKASTAEQLSITPLVKICAHHTVAQPPAEFTTAPIAAIRGLLNKLNWKTSDVDVFEINEAFAVVVLAAINELSLSADRVNPHGGACVLGHPIGASGARILTTLIYALRRLDGQRGIASLCIGGGEATAVAIERLDTH